MKKILLGLVMLSVSFSFTAFADEGKVGIVNFQEVIQKSPDYETLKTKLEKQFQPKQKKILDAQKELQKEVEELRRNESVMKDEDKKKIQEKLIKGQQALQAMEVGFQKEYMAEQEKVFQELISKVKAKVAKVADKKGLEMVLPKDAVLYTKNGPDITKDVIDALK